MVNPLDVSAGNVEPEEETYITAAGHYENGAIVCVMPEILNPDPERMLYNVDVALNG